MAQQEASNQKLERGLSSRHVEMVAGLELTNTTS